MKNEKKVDTQQEEKVEETVKDSVVEKLNEELSNAVKSAEEYKDKWQRSVAEFDNYKKRNAKLWQDAYNQGVSDLIIKILPIGDTLDWAITLGLDEKTEQGIKNVSRKFSDTLKEMGIEEINPVDEEFDPNIAEAVMQVPAEEGEQTETIKQVLQKGYKIKDKIIRYAKVSVRK